MDATDKKDVNSIAAASDNEIIKRVLQGEKDLYGILVRRYNQRLYRIAMSIVNNDADAEDAMQVAYINAYESLPKFAFKAAFSTWLTKILINECLQKLKRKERLTISLNESVIHPNFYQQQTTDMQTPAVKSLNNELKQILERTIRELPEKYRTVFIMREIEGMNVADTKSCLDISEVNVKVRLNRAKSILRESLSKYYKNEDILHFHLNRCDNMLARVLKQIL